MNRSLKILAASVLACSTSGVFAAIDTDEYTNAGGGDLSGELFVSVFRNVAGQEQSSLFDTGITAAQLLGGTVANGTILGNVGSFFTTAPLSSFVFNAGAIANGGEGGTFGNIFTTNNEGGVIAQAGLIDLTGANGINSNMAQLVLQTQIGGDPANNDDFTGLVAGNHGFHNSQYWNSTMGGANATIGTEGGLNTPLALWAITVNADFATFSHQLLGYLVADSASGNISFSTGDAAVPLPAAVWLLGSGLAGLLGVSRRRRRQILA